MSNHRHRVEQKNKSRHISCAVDYYFFFLWKNHVNLKSNCVKKKRERKESCNNGNDIIYVLITQKIPFPNTFQIFFTWVYL